MENNITIIEALLDDFRQGKISEELLKEKMKQNGTTDYSQFADEHAAAINIIQRYNVMQQVADIHKQFKVVEKPKAKVVSFKTLNPLMKVAAILILFIASAGTYFIATTSQSGVYNTLTQGYHVQINRAESTQQVSQIVQAFNNKDYKTVVTEFSKINNPGTRELFLSGYAYLQLNEYNTATNSFKKIITDNNKSGERLYQDEAEYYLILSSVQQKNYTDAYNYANNIYNDHYHTYNDKISFWLLMKLKWLS